MFTQIKVYLAVAFCAILGYFYYLYTTMKEDLIAEKEVNTKLYENIKNQEEYISRLKQDYDNVLKIRETVQKTEDEQNKKIQELKDKEIKHNLENLSYKKPKLIQNTINKSTIQEFREIENITKGAEL